MRVGKELTKQLEKKMDDLAQKLADILVDYRKGESLNPKKENVLQWVSQFSAENQSVILEEMANSHSKRIPLKIELI